MRGFRIVAALVAISALSLLGAASAGAAAPRIICPLLSTCCPLPVAGALDGGPAQSVCCEPPTVLCLALPTIVSAPDPSVAGRSVTVSGLVPGAGSGAQVTLWQKLPGEKSFQPAATAGTNSSGQYGFGESLVQTNREWYVTSSSERSATIDQRVRAAVTLALTVSRGRHEVVAHGRVSPSHAGQRVLLERKTAGGFVVVARAKLSRSSSYSAVLPFAGRILLQTVFAGDQRNVRSVSSGEGVARAA